MSFLGEVVAAGRVAGGDGGFGLVHELVYLIDHILLVCGERVPCKLFEVFFCSGGELRGGTLLRGLVGSGAADELNAGFVGSAVVNNFFGGRTGMGG